MLHDHSTMADNNNNNPTSPFKDSAREARRDLLCYGGGYYYIATGDRDFAARVIQNQEAYIEKLMKRQADQAAEMQTLLADLKLESSTNESIVTKLAEQKQEREEMEASYQAELEKLASRSEEQEQSIASLRAMLAMAIDFAERNQTTFHIHIEKLIQGHYTDATLSRIEFDRIMNTMKLEFGSTAVTDVSTADQTLKYARGEVVYPVFDPQTD